MLCTCTVTLAEMVIDGKCFFHGSEVMDWERELLTGIIICDGCGMGIDGVYYHHVRLNANVHSGCRYGRMIKGEDISRHAVQFCDTKNLRKG